MEGIFIMNKPKRGNSRSVFRGLLSNRLFYAGVFFAIAMAILVIVISGQTIYVVRVDNHYELYRGLQASPENVLKHIGIELGTYDETTVKDGDIISKIDVIRAYEITLQVDGLTRTVHSTGQTVSEILKKEGVELGAYDAVSPAPDNIPAGGSAVIVSRGSLEYVEETVTLPYKTVEVESDDYYVGTTIKSAKGQDGEAVRKYAMIYRDGELVSKELVSETVTTEAIDAYNIIGTHSAAQSSARLTSESTRVEPPPSSGSNSGKSGNGGSGNSGSNSGSNSGNSGSNSGKSGNNGSGNSGSSGGSGNSGKSGSSGKSGGSGGTNGYGGQRGNIVTTDNGDGTGTVTTVGGTTYKYKACYYMQATAYSDRMTALGNKPSWGTVAVDKSVIKLRTNLYICNRYFTWQYSEKAFAGDVGVIGQRVDLWMPNETMCYTFGRRPCWVYVIP